MILGSPSSECVGESRSREVVQWMEKRQRRRVRLRMWQVIADRSEVVAVLAAASTEFN
jgi:hypothetical protein